MPLLMVMLATSTLTKEPFLNSGKKKIFRYLPMFVKGVTRP